MSAVIRVLRGETVESVHRVHVAVVDGEGRLVARAGDPERVTYYRSAAKPFQALPLVEDGVVEELGLTPEELALCCGSHGGEPRHVDAARSILSRAGLDEEDLECGGHRPRVEEAGDAMVRAGEEFRPIHNNCSGKHAGMLALAAVHGWPTGGYLDPEHPVQRRMLREVSRWTGLPEEEIGTGIDGCGVVCFAVPLDRMARSFAGLMAAAEEGQAAGRVVEAMARHPYFVGGTGLLCTDLMDRAGDRVVVKTGAEGVYGAGLRGRGLGVALKAEDGASRASQAALLRVLSLLEVLDDDEADALRRPVTNTRGARVGTYRVDFNLERT